MLDQRTYNIKHFLFSRFPLLEKIIAFNRQKRDTWIKFEAANVSKGSKVLDVGAGSCPYRPLFKHCHYFAQDFGQLSPKQLQGRSGYGQLDIISDINLLPIASQSVELVICTEVLEHVPEPILTVMELGRVLKGGGVLLISAPLQSGLHQEPYHFYGGYTPYWYKKFLGKAGFTNIEIKPVGGLFGAYSTLGLYATSYLAPTKIKTLPFFWRMILLIFWVITLPWFFLIAPFLFFGLDRLVPIDTFTSGYHVKAFKSASASTDSQRVVL